MVPDMWFHPIHPPWFLCLKNLGMGVPWSTLSDQSWLSLSQVGSMGYHPQHLLLPGGHGNDPGVKIAAENRSKIIGLWSELMRL
jgi:hypothetical protein